MAGGRGIPDALLETLVNASCSWRARCGCADACSAGALPMRLPCFSHAAVTSAAPPAKPASLCFPWRESCRGRRMTRRLLRIDGIRRPISTFGDLATANEPLHVIYLRKRGPLNAVSTSVESGQPNIVNTLHMDRRHPPRGGRPGRLGAIYGCRAGPGTRKPAPVRPIDL